MAKRILTEKTAKKKLAKKKPAKKTVPWTPNRPLLDDQQEMFVQALVKQGAGMNMTEAYLEAYPHVKRTTAGNSGHRLMKKDEISLRLEYLKQKAADLAVSTLVERRQFLTMAHRTAPADFMEECPDVGLVINYGPEHPKRCMVRKIKQRTMTSGPKGEDKQEVDVRITEMDLIDPIAAIKELNKMDGAYPTEKQKADAMSQIAANGYRFVNNIDDEG